MPVFRVPPFPGAKQIALATADGRLGSTTDQQVDQLIERSAELKVGGSYWGPRRPLPQGPYTVVRVTDRAARAEAIAMARTPVVECYDADYEAWHLLGGASELIVSAEDELALIGAIAGVPVRCVGNGGFSELAGGSRLALRNAFRAAALDGWAYFDPFTGEETDAAAAIELCGFWRRLIDSNRSISAAIGFAKWKRPTVAPLLWGGSGKVPFEPGRRSFAPGQRVAVWKSRTSGSALQRLEASGADLIEVEDGFIRSSGLGADCVPPLSIVVDPVGIYFDPRRPSALELLLQDGEFPDEMLDRARRLRELVVERGISKYAAGAPLHERRDSAKRYLLVPGQVEDDRSILSGGAVRTNLELLRRVRERAPDAHIIYKPHPDVEAGHRIGAIADELCLTLANEVSRDQPIQSLIAAVDEVHVNTSLAGFEALLRLKEVTTYGVPFFAGWGLTRDLGKVPSGRTARRSLDELVAAALLLYPRYVDPVTGLPCPPEALIQRLSDNRQATGPLVPLRRLQGRLKRVASALRSWL